MKDNLLIGGRSVGESFPPYIVAEISSNHNGDIEKALEHIELASEAGADAVKLQTYTADTMTLDSDANDFKITEGLWKGRTLYDLYEEAHTPWEWHAALFKKARDCGLQCFSSPFNEGAVDFLEQFDPPAYKVASLELVDLPLLRKIASTKKPVIMSTGLSDLEEISEAVETLQTAGCEDLVLLHCVSSYPAPPEDYNLRTIPDMAKKFNVVVGISDHTLGITTSLTAVGLGAAVIEKHFTVRRSDKSLDAAFSLEPKEFKLLCDQSREAWSALGSPDYDLKDSEKENLKYRRSIYVVKSIASGEKFTEDNLRRIRPGYGLAPKFFPHLLGKIASCDVPRGSALNWSMIKNWNTDH